ncbi:MAG: HEAT repeat domain-containing protein [Anaerolineales bacterium]|jgi:hypothetical protein
MNTQIASSLKETQISHLITDLGDDNGLVRQRARLQLEHLGLESIPALLEALQSQNVHVRWEALRALGELHAPETAGAITNLLMDEDTSVRWAAMESLIHMGRASLHPLLDSFIKNFDSLWMREGVRHILRVFNDRKLLNNREVILFEELEKQAIPGFEAGWNSQQAWAAEKALELLDQDAVQSR